MSFGLRRIIWHFSDNGCAGECISRDRRFSSRLQAERPDGFSAVSGTESLRVRQADETARATRRIVDEE